MSLIRPSRARRTSLGLLLWTVACVSMVPQSVGAQGHGRSNGFGMFHGAHADQRGARQAERAQQRAARAAQPREAPAQRPRDIPQQAAPPIPQAPAPAQENGRPGRLTPDERRALRQQINDAGRDVYRPNRP